MKTRKTVWAALAACLLLLLCVCAAMAEGQPGVVLEETEITLVKGKSQKLKYTIENTENPKKAKVTWESSDEAVATVDKGGTVKAKDGGSAVITCTAELEDGTIVSAAATVTVTVPVAGVKILTKANTAVPYGTSLQLEYAITPENATDQTVTWASSNEEVMTVDGEGRVTAVGAGKTNVTVTAGNGKNAKVALIVPTLAPSADTFTVTAKENIYRFTYCGNDFEKNVQIAAKGGCFEFTAEQDGTDVRVLLTPLKPGEGTLTVTDKKDAAAKFTVNVTVSDDAFPIGKMLRIDGAAYDPETGVLTVAWTNTGSEIVSDAEVRIVPLDAAGEALTIGEGYWEEIPEEERVYHIITGVRPGEQGNDSFVIGPTYPEAVNMEIAFDRIVRPIPVEGQEGAYDMETLILPDDRMCWYSTAEGAYTRGPANDEPYTPPAEDAAAKAEKVRFGFLGAAVTGELAAAYGGGHSGILVMAVEEGSLAEAMGLEPWDLIFSVNDIPWDTEPYIMTLAAAALADGQPVTFMVERDDTEFPVSLQPE